MRILFEFKPQKLKKDGSNVKGGLESQIFTHTSLKNYKVIKLKEG